VLKYFWGQTVKNAIFIFSREEFFFQILWLQNVIHSYLFLEILLSLQSYFHDFLEDKENGDLKHLLYALYWGEGRGWHGGILMQAIQFFIQYGNLNQVKFHFQGHLFVCF